MVAEMITGLIQIRVFGRRYDLLNQFSKVINASCRGTIAFWNLSRAFGANVVYVSLIVMWIGWICGIIIVTPETAGLYGVSVVFLITVNDSLQWSLRQMIVSGSIMISVERTFLVADLPPEKELRTDYDEQHQITYDNYEAEKDKVGLNSRF